MLPLALGLALLAGLAATGVPGEEDADRLETAAVSIPTGEPWDALRQAEYERSSEKLVPLLDHEDAAVRAGAALALGRCGDRGWPSFSKTTSHLGIARLLVRALRDEDVEVRRTAAFAIGLNAHPYPWELLLKACLPDADPDPDAEVRARCVEAVTKLSLEGEARDLVRGGVLLLLDDPAPRVRAEAAVGTHRWSRADPGADEVDAALLARLESEEDPDVVRALLFALQRRSADAAREAFLAHAMAEDVMTRLYAVRGLARIAPDASIRPALANALDDADWRVACEAALGLGAYPEAAADLAARAEAPGDFTNLEPAHLRRAIWTVMLSYPPYEDWADGEPGPIEQDESDAVFAAQIETMFHLTSTAPESSESADLAGLVAGFRSTYSNAPDALIAALYRGVARHPAGRCVPVLVAALERETSPLVLEAIAEGLGKHPGDASRAALHGLLAHPDNGVRLAAVLALREMPDASDLAPLQACFESSEGDIATEIRFNVLRDVAAIGAAEGHAIVALGFSDPHPFVQKVAAEAFAALPPPEKAPSVKRIARRPPRAPRAGKEYPAFERNPLVAVETTRGTMHFELFPAEAPTHVHNFLTLIGEDHYDGLPFHRVVPDFVIQGGDYRGDGNGGATWNGHPLPNEVGPRKYVRGSLGMPRNEDWDSGGSQLFVTHRPAPHLDGRFTIFGELRTGEDVLDAIEVGDRILDVRLVERP